MRFVGIDPGKEGAIALLGAGGAVEDVIATPLIVATTKGSRDEFDLPAIAAFFRGLADPGAPDRGLFVTIEKLHPMPMKKGGTIANHARGVAAGWAWMLAAYRIPYQLVVPQTWQRAMFAGTAGADTKQRAIAAAGRLFPSVCLVCGCPGEHPPERAHARRTKKQDGIADALLIAEWGRIKRSGGEVFAAAAS
jgi:hypothetical protein